MARSGIPAFQLTAYPRQAMAASMELGRRTLDDAGAMVTDIQRFSNKQIVFQINVRIGEWAHFLHAVLASELNLDSPELRADLTPWADADGDLMGTVTLVISGDGHERRDQIPHVPG